MIKVLFAVAAVDPAIQQILDDTTVTFADLKLLVLSLFGFFVAYFLLAYALRKPLARSFDKELD